MMHGMKTYVTCITERGQISIPAEIRSQLNWKPGHRLLWEATADGGCSLCMTAPATRGGAQAMLGFASTFRKTRRTSDWMKELREGEGA
jgi:AbrB family looped-hinge helix DNA binding protein